MLIKGEDLTADQRSAVLESFINRDTIESPWTNLARQLTYSTGPLVSDDQWIRDRAFHFTADGRLNVGHGCVRLKEVPNAK